VTAGCLAVAAAGCGGGAGKAKPADPLALLRQAKAAIDSTTGVHFVLAGSRIPSGAQGVTGGEGDAVRPDAFQGSLTVSGAGLSGTVKVTSVGHVVWAKLPLLPGFHKINPADYGFGDPGQFINADTGLASLLTTPTSAAYDGQARVDGVVLDRVKAQLPGPPVAALLGSADSKAPVAAELGIDPATHQIRSVVLTGPFFSTQQPSTFTLTLSRYGESIHVSAPG
jgi:LppX_LprAFG lipoprotein